MGIISTVAEFVGWNGAFCGVAGTALGAWGRTAVPRAMEKTAAWLKRGADKVKG